MRQFLANTQVKAAYDDRFKSLTSALSTLYDELCNDEIIQEMKKDKSSVVFLPAHLNEVIQRYLMHEREQYLHNTLSKVMDLESQLTESKQEIQQWRDENIAKTTQFRQQEDHLQQNIHRLKQNLAAKVSEVEHLKNLAEKKTHEIDLLEHSFEQSSRELAIIEGIDKQEQQFKKELKEQLVQVTNQRNALSEEVRDLRTKCTLLTEENERLQTAHKIKLQEEAANRKKIQSMMKQVESILDEEAQESNSAIMTAHQKMKAFRDRMISELQREKRLSTALHEELTTMKSLRDDLNRENRRLQEEDNQIREKLIHEQSKLAAVMQELKELQQRWFDNKVYVKEVETKCQYLEQRLSDQEKVMKQELKINEEKLRVELKHQFEDEQRHLDQRTTAMKMHYDNELSKLSNQLRGSYSFQPQGPGDVLARLGTSSDALSTELSYRNLLEKLYVEREESVKNHEKELTTLRAALVADFELELKAAEKGWANNHEQVVRGLKDMLSEASKNIDKLKSMVKEGRVVIDLQNQRIEQLKKDNHALMDLKLPHYNEETTLVHHAQPGPGNVVSQNDNPNSITMDQTPMRTSNYGATMRIATPTSVQEVIKMRVPDYKFSNASNADQTNKLYLSLQDTQARDRQNFDAQEAAVANHRGTDRKGSHSRSIATKDVTSSNASAASHTSAVTFASTVRGKKDSELDSHSATTQSSGRSCNHGTSRSVQQEDLASKSSKLSAPNATVGSQNNVAGQLVTSALEEARIAKLRCMELEEEITNLRTTLHELEIEIDARKREEYSLHYCIESKTEEILGLNASVVTLSKSLSALQSECQRLESIQISSQQQHSTMVGKSGECDNSTIVSFSSLGDPLTNNLQGMLKPASSTQVSATTPPCDRLEESPKQTFCDAGVNTFDSNISELIAKLQHLELDKQQLQDRFTHQLELVELHKVDVEKERNRIVEMKKKESQLYQFIVRIDTLYRQQLYGLKQDLQHIRSCTTNFASWSASEIYSTVNNYKLQFQVIFDHYHRKQEQALKDLRVSMSTSHHKELNHLESKFIEQINLLNKKHSKELEKLHLELLARTEKALNVSSSREMDNISLLSGIGQDSLSSSISNAQPTNASVLLNESLEMLSQSAMKLTGPGLTLTEKDKVSSTHRTNGNLSVVSQAFESVLRGVLQGMRDQECISNETSEKVASLAQAHQEPSFAASAAARALIGEEIDRFMVNLVKKKYDMDTSPSGSPWSERY
jgi:hypothetical protein